MLMGDTNKTLQNLRLLQELIKREENLDTFVETTVAKLLDYESERLGAYRKTLQGKLAAFEQQYGLRTAEFCRDFRAGRLGDTMDFFEWSALAEIYQDVSKALAAVDKAHDGIEHL
jgi:hypothetical protein